MSDSPLVDMAQNIYRKTHPGEQGQNKKDTSWHKQMVSDANESFKKLDEKRKVGGASKARDMVAKRTTRKAMLRKVSSSK